MKNQSYIKLDDFIKIMCSITPSFSKDELKLPFNKTSIDSLDLIIVRVEIEKILGNVISDENWYSFNSLNEIYEYCKSRKIFLQSTSTPRLQARRSQEITINMPQMANSALSENWLLKELGNIHWELLSDGLNLKSSMIMDEFSERLYATFTRIKVKCSPLENFKENEIIELDGQINRYGKNTYLSQVIGNSKSNSFSATLMTSFTKRNKEHDNFLQKSTPNISKINIPEVKYLPMFLNEYRLLSKKLLDSYKLLDEQFILDHNQIYEKEYIINPYYEINGVGLLYFSSYPIISDICTFKYFNKLPELTDFDKQYFTISRDIFYYANCETRDELVLKINSYDILPNDCIKIFTSLYRKRDDKLMSDIFTIKQKNELIK